MIKTLFLFEWKKLYRTPLYLILLAFFILIGVYSVRYGNTVVRTQKIVTDSLESGYTQKINSSIQKFKSDTLTKQGKIDFSSVSEPSSVNYYIKPYAIFLPNDFSALSIGQRDVLPFYKQISTERNFTQSYAPDISNPEVLSEGNIDLSFVIIYLLPLLMIGFTYNILSGEKENGTFPLMAVQVGKPSRIIVFKYIVRISIIFLVLILLNLYAIVHVSGAGGIYTAKAFYWISIVCSYFLFWAALCYFFIVLGKSSAVTVFYMSASWLLLTLLLPFMLNLYVDLAYPTVLRADMASEQRKIEEDVWSIKPKELIWNFYNRHPEYKTGNINDTFQYSPRRFAAYYDEMERRLYPVAKKYNDRIDERNRLMTSLSDLLPTLTAQKALSQVAQNDLASFKRFDESSLRFQLQWQAYIYRFIFDDKKFNAEDYNKFPVYLYHDGNLSIRSHLLLIFSALLLIIITNYINKKQLKK